MLLQIPDVLSAAQIAHARARLEHRRLVHPLEDPLVPEARRGVGEVRRVGGLPAELVAPRLVAHEAVERGEEPLREGERKGREGRHRPGDEGRIEEA